MKQVKVWVGVNGTDIRKNGHVVGRKYQVDVTDRISGGYGIGSDGELSRWSRLVTVLVPDWVEPSIKWDWEMSRPGYKSTSGSDHLCFVTCRAPITVEEYYHDAPHEDLDVLVQRAIDGGFRFHYPTETGAMAQMDIERAA